ncbi:MAG TPA: glutamine cyclotransferase [Syntrophaceae bacterium]|nr:glutamine cyclotransferase [Syntrophaceae bacterium]
MILSYSAKGYRREKGNDALGLKPAFAVFLMVAFLWGPCTVFSEVFLTGRSQLSPFMQSKAPVASIVVKNTYPHDTEAFTQGLLFHQGFFYESTGLLGKSTLARKDMKTGKVLQEVKLPREFFGEGIVLLKDKIYQLTWQNEAVLIYDARSLREIKRMKYTGEGWGLASDGKYLLMSNGSSTITFRDPKSFKTVREIQVRDGDNPVERLNELEFIKGEIWANVYMEDVIVRISPKNGRVTGWIDLSELRSYLARSARVDVINGIAYDGEANRIFLTGKYWPKIFEIQINP